jgi:hypothetical protein
MPSRTAQITQVGKRRIELSNLAKVLFPDDHIVKAQLIEYYFKIAPTILAYAKGRPLSLVRYPDGIGGESFFQKNRPEWAPDWLEHVTLGEEKKDYVIATEEASLVWLANLACIELHQMHSRAPFTTSIRPRISDFPRSRNWRWSSRNIWKVSVIIPSSKQRAARGCMCWRPSNRSGDFTKRLRRQRPLPSLS